MEQRELLSLWAKAVNSPPNWVPA